MPKEFSRGKKVADLIQRELAILIQREVKDPRIGMVTINDASVSRDLAYSDIYFTVLGAADPKDTEAALNQASGFLRSQLAKILNTRTTPRLRFHYDATIETGARLDEVINSARARDLANHQPDDDAGVGTEPAGELKD